MLAAKILILLVVAGTFFAVWRLESGWRIILTPFLFLSYFELVRVLPPFFLADIYSETDSVLPLLAAALAFVAVVMGFLTSYGYYRAKRRDTSRFSVAVVPRLEVARGEKMGVLVVVILLLASGFMLYGGVPPVGRAVVGLLSGDGGVAANFVSDQRYELTKAAYFGGDYRGQGALRVLQRIGWTMVMGYAMLLWVDRRTLKRSMWFAASVLCAWIFVAGDGTRGPFLNAMLIVLAMYSLRMPLKVRTVAIVFCAGTAVAILLSLYSNKMYNLLDQAQGNFIQDAVSKVITRIFLANGMNDVRVMDMVNSGELPLRWGAAHFREFASAIPGIEYGVPLSYELFQILNPASQGAVFYSGTYLSIAYIDFGWYGLPPLFFVAGLVIGYMQRVLFQSARSPWRFSVVATIAFLTVTILRSGFDGFAVQLLVVGVVYFIHRISATMARQVIQTHGTKRMIAGPVRLWQPGRSDD